MEGCDISKVFLTFHQFYALYLVDGCGRLLPVAEHLFDGGEVVPLPALCGGLVVVGWHRALLQAHQNKKGRVAKILVKKIEIDFFLTNTWQ